MPPRPSASTTLRAGSYGAVTHSLPPRSGGMHLLTRGGGPSSVVEPLAPHRDPIPSTHPRHDFTWTPSQDIIFHTPSTPTSRPTKAIPRQASAPSYINLPTSSAIPIDSATEVGRVDSSGRPLRKSAFRGFLKGAAQQHQVTNEPRPTVGPDHKPGASAALCEETQVEKQPPHGQIWWQPVCFETTGARPVMSKIFSKIHMTKRKQSVIPSTRRLQGVRSVSSRRSRNFEGSKQVADITHGEYLERDQTLSQAKVKPTAAHRKKSHSRATNQQWATEGGRLVGPANACKTLGNKDCGIEEHCRLRVKKLPRRLSVSSAVNAHLTVSDQRNLQDTRDTFAADMYSRYGVTPTIQPPVYKMFRGLQFQRYSATRRALSGNAIVRQLSKRAEQRSGAGKNIDRTESAVHGAESQAIEYRAYRAPFDRVRVGYFELVNTSWVARKDCPGLKKLWTYLTIELINMQNEFCLVAHRYRISARIGKDSGAVYRSEGLRWSYRSWRRRVREFYLRNPFVEQKDYAVRSLDALWDINFTRLRLGLDPIYGGGRLKDAFLAFAKASQEFLACVKERDALGKDDVDKELDRRDGRISPVIEMLGNLLYDLRRLLGCWERFSSIAPPFRVRQKLYRCLVRLRRSRRSIIDVADQLRVVTEERILRQLAKSAVEPNSSLSKDAEAPIRSEHSHQPHQQSLNIHATAALRNAHFGDLGPVQSIPENLFDLVERPNAVTSDVEQPPLQCPFQIPEELRKKALAASTSEDIFWQYNLYQGPAGERVKVHYCRNKESSDRIAKLFLDKSVIGFDIEWKPQASAAEGTKKNVSLVQLASEERIALFHIARFGKDGNIDDLVPPNLKKVMEAADITKVGVAVKADCTRLRKFMGIESRGLLELSHLYKLIKFSNCDVKRINKSLVSLAQQVEDHLLLPMWKGEVRSSDWSEELNFQQIQYAASDSYAGLQLYHAMEAKRKAIQPTPPCPAHAELNLPIRLANGQTVATYNEPVEDEDETPTTELNANNDVLPEVEQMARDFLNITIEDVRQSKVTPSAKPTPKRSPKPISQKSPEITAAEVWVAAWRTSLPVTYKAKAMPASLRAYALWHVQGFSVQETASLLRDPPLQVTTVSSYILEAIRMEKLAYDADRLKEVLAHLPESVAKSRYQSLRRQLE